MPGSVISASHTAVEMGSLPPGPPSSDRATRIYTNYGCVIILISDNNCDDTAFMNLPAFLVAM